MKSMAPEWSPYRFVLIIPRYKDSDGIKEWSFMDSLCNGELSWDLKIYG
jgi:hypothetical protein